MLFRKKLLAAIASALVIVGIPGAAQASESDVSNSFSADVTPAMTNLRCTSARFITLANGWPTASPTDRSGSRYCWLEVSDLHNNASHRSPV